MLSNFLLHCNKLLMTSLSSPLPLSPPLSPLPLFLSLTDDASREEEPGSLTVVDNLLQLSRQARVESQQERQLQESQELSDLLSQDQLPLRDATPPLLGGPVEEHSDSNGGDGGVALGVGMVQVQGARSCLYNVPSLGGKMDHCFFFVYLAFM